MRIRHAVADDADQVCDVFLRSRRSAMPWLAATHTDTETRIWLENEVLARQQLWVAEDDGAVLGFAALSDGWLHHLYLDPDHLGRGIGRQLLDVVKAASPGGVRLHVFRRNTRALRFYRQAGFMHVRDSDGSDNEELEPDSLYQWMPPR